MSRVKNILYILCSDQNAVNVKYPYITEFDVLGKGLPLPSIEWLE